MVNPVDIDDVAARWRPLTEAEQIVIQSWLDDAWAQLGVYVPDLESRIDLGTLSTELVIGVVAEAVIRKAQNPEGRRQMSVAIDDATRSWTIDNTRSAGDLYFTSRELELLGGKGGRAARIFSVMPS